MARIVKVKHFGKRAKKIEYLKLKLRQKLWKYSLLCNICLATYIYNPEILTTIHDKVAPMVESLINKLPL